MSSTYLTSPARARSRFSKALPVPPEDRALPQSPVAEHMSLLGSPVERDLPSPPADKPVVTSMSIRRRPVGGETEPTKTASISSSVYSDSPGISRALSDSSSRGTKDSLSGEDSEETGPTPPLPPKDSQKQQYPSQNAYNDLARPPSIFQSSPPRPEIWKRRSVKSDKSISFTDLKLDWSNGSTASPPRKQEQPADRPSLPRSIRGRKPVPSRPAPPQPDLMGGKLAKLKNKLLGDKSDKSSVTVKDETPKSAHKYSPFKRLPTPEALESDQKAGPLPPILSPLSPDTPPQDAPLLPPKSDARSLGSLVSSTQTLQSPSTPSLLVQHARKSSETFTVTSEPAVMQSPQPQKAFAARILTPQPSPDKTSPLSLPSPAVRGIHFPRLPSIAPPGTVMPGPPLTEQHFDCYQSHKYMRGTKNTLCPVACMVCRRKDNDQRWRCTWCCLSACGSCMKVLTSVPGKDLRRAMERIGR